MVEIPQETLDRINRDLRKAVELIGEAEDSLAGMRAAFRRIKEIVHTPTPGSEKAYSHYGRDFDEIRKLVEPYCK
jgi:hypothetical protein